MVRNEINKILLGGLKNFASDSNTTIETTQILVQVNHDGKFLYFECQNKQPKRQVRFAQILGKKFDILNFEGLAKPFLKKSFEYFSHELQADAVRINVLIFLAQKGMSLAIYEGNDFKNEVLLSSHFDKLGM